MQILYFNLNLGRMKGAIEALRHRGVREPPTSPWSLAFGCSGHTQLGEARTACSAPAFAAPAQGWKACLLQLRLHLVSTYYMQDTEVISCNPGQSSGGNMVW